MKTEYRIINECRNHHPDLSITNEELVNRFQNGNEDAFTELVLRCGRIVTSIIKKQIPDAIHTSSFEDYYQQGLLAIRYAAIYFDINKNTSFISYAYFWVIKLVLQYKHDMKLVRAPDYIISKIHLLHQLQSEYFLSNNELPSDEYLIEHLMVSSDEYEKLVTYDKQQFVSFETEDEDIRSELDYIRDTKNLEPEAEYEKKELHDLLIENINRVAKNERDKDVILKHFGLYSGEPMTLDEIGKEYGITRERVRQIKERMLGRLRNKDTLSQLRPFLTTI